MKKAAYKTECTVMKTIMQKLGIYPLKIWKAILQNVDIDEILRATNTQWPVCAPCKSIYLGEQQWLTPWHRAGPAGKGHLFLIIHSTIETGISSGIVSLNCFLCAISCFPEVLQRVCATSVSAKNHDIEYNQS